MSGSPRVVGEAKVQNMCSRRPEAAGEQTAGHTLALSVGRRHFEESACYLLLSNESRGLGSVSLASPGLSCAHTHTHGDGR